MVDFERFLLVRGKIGKCRSRMDRSVTGLWRSYDYGV